MTDQAMTAIRQRILDATASNVYIGDLPENGMNCLALHPVDGYNSTQYFGQRDVHEPLVQVLVRTNDYALGEKLYMAALKAVDKFTDSESGILSCVNVGSPGYLGRNSQGFCTWHFMLHVTLVNY